MENSSTFEKVLHKAEMAFRNSIGEVSTLDAWVAETSLEFRRFMHLRQIGINAYPESDSLLDRFLNYMPSQWANFTGDQQTGTYKDVFGHSVPYIWRVPFNDLTCEGAAPSNQPGGA